MRSSQEDTHAHLTLFPVQSHDTGVTLTNVVSDKWSRIINTQMRESFVIIAYLFLHWEHQKDQIRQHELDKHKSTCKQVFMVSDSITDSQPSLQTFHCYIDIHWILWYDTGLWEQIQTLFVFLVNIVQKTHTTSKLIILIILFSWL